MIEKKQTWIESLLVYKDIRMLRILLIGAISGFPWVLIASSLSLWLKEEGFSRSTIGWAGLIWFVYSINYWWAPLIDRIRIPILTDKIGHRRAWIVFCQLIILLSLLSWFLLDPNGNGIGIIKIYRWTIDLTSGLAVIIFVGLIIAIASATQDITIDALRIEQIKENEGKSMAAAAAMAVVGWWTGYKLGGMIALLTAEHFQKQGIENYWQTTYLVLTMLIILMNIGLMFVHEPDSKDRISKQKINDKKIIGTTMPTFFTWIVGTILGPLVSFFKKNGITIAIGILGFVFLFKIGEAFLGRMSILFYKEIGFSKSEIAFYSKGVGWVTTVVFTLLGGIFAMRSGSLKTMFIAGILMAATNLLFAFLNWYVQAIPLVSYEFDFWFLKWWHIETTNHQLVFGATVALDDITSAFATVAFVAFISLLVDRTYTATQYAALASIGTMGRTVLSSSSGAVVDWLQGDWSTFFILTAIMVIPSLICLWFIRNNLKKVGAK
jgi:PAT family beta-lactamase induction signal transducer AmpG|tara:strand:- start:637 stop:2118 length:1482 start_codon:yes stop_codon:yes gene_type:complete